MATTAPTLRTYAPRLNSGTNQLALTRLPFPLLLAPMTMIHTIALSLLEGLTQNKTLTLLRHTNDAQLIFEQPDVALADFAPSFQQEVMHLLRANGAKALQKAQAEWEFCQEHGIRPIAITASDYPQRLKDCPDAPAVLFYRGSAEWNVPHVLSVVGTRRISPYGKDLCRMFCQELARLFPDTLVVSGLAYGVDVHVHKACLEQQLPTIGVLAHGLDQIYPAAHRNTACEMLKNGGLLTEHPRGVRPFAGNFVRRNRIVAGMADATIVIESADHGGALITARLAGEYNRTVCAFPGRTTDKFSEGCLHLIRQRRAELVTSATDVLELLNWIEPAQPDAPVQLELFGPLLTPDQQLMARVLQDNDGCTLSQLMLHTGFDLPKINTLVFELEMLNCISLSSGNCYRWKPQ